MSDMNNDALSWQEAVNVVQGALQQDGSPTRLSHWFNQQMVQLQQLHGITSHLLDAFAGQSAPIAAGVAKGKLWALDDQLSFLYVMGSADLFYQACVASCVSSGEILFDVGANAGFHTLVGLSAVGDAGKVIAIEPDEGNIATLQRHLAINTVENCDIVEAVAAGEDGSVSFYPNSDPGLGTTLAQEGAGWAEAVEVPSFRLDTLASVHGVPAFVKIDVEGAEHSVLEGARALLEDEANTTVYFIEIHTPEATQAVITLFEENDYVIYGLARGSAGSAISMADVSYRNVHHIVAARRSDQRFPCKVGGQVTGEFQLVPMTFV